MKMMRNWRESVNGWPAALSIALLAILAGLTCQSAKRPSVPVVSGPNTGVAGMPLTFRATSEDTDGDSVAFMFDWGDTTTKVWTNYTSSGETISASHTYADSGSFGVKAKAKNGKGRESGWSGLDSVWLSGSGPEFPDSLVASIWVGGRIRALAVSPDGQRLYMAITDRDLIRVMRTTDFVLIDSIMVGRAPWSLAFSPDGLRLYIVVMGSDSVVAIRTSDDAVVGGALVGHEPRDIAVAPDGDLLYLVDSRDDSLVIIRTSDFSLAAKIGLDSVPYDVEISSDGSTIGVASFGRSTLSVISTATDSLVNRVGLAAEGTALCFARDDRRAYVGELNNNIEVVSLTTGTVETTIVLDASPEQLATTPDGYYLLVANGSSAGMPVIRESSNQIVGRLRVPDFPSSVAVSPDGNRVYAADQIRGVCVFARR